VEERQTYGSLDVGGYFLDLPFRWFWVRIARVVEMRWLKDRGRSARGREACRILKHGGQVIPGGSEATHLFTACLL
jgi:hypothetical protein